MKVQRKVLWFWINWRWKIPVRVLSEPKQNAAGDWKYLIKLGSKKRWRLK